MHIFIRALNWALRHCLLSWLINLHRRIKQKQFIILGAAVIVIVVYYYLTTIDVLAIIVRREYTHCRLCSDRALVLRFWDLMTKNGSTTEEFFAGKKLPNLWVPNETFTGADSDRIVAQLVFGMELHSVVRRMRFTLKEYFDNLIQPKKIQDLRISDSNMPWSGSHTLNSKDCPGFQDEVVQKCTVIQSIERVENVDAVVQSHRFHFSVDKLTFVFKLESPLISDEVSYNKSIEKLATYTRFSDMTAPYGKWVYFDPSRKFIQQEKDYSKGKTKMAVALISNCRGRNNRLGLITQLRKYMEVDVFGDCGRKKEDCDKGQHDYCLKKLSQEYSYYFSFENSNCRDYITEKLFNILEYDFLPVVFGAHPSDYAVACPEKSYIHVEDFGSIKELAEYLQYLAKTPEKYNSYFQWKGTGKLINTFFFCRLCTLVLYDDLVPSPPYRKNPVSFTKQQCLPRGKWYWLREENSIERKKERRRERRNDNVATMRVWQG